jgi:hypothetical protein
MALLPAHIAKIEFGATDIPNQSYTINKTANVAKGHNARDGVYRAATLLDASGSAELFFDSAEPPDTAYDEGSTLTAKFYVDATHFYTGSVIIETLEISAPGVEGELIKVSFNWSLASGTLTPPAFT